MKPIEPLTIEYPAWVNAAATRPVAFAQVREDPRIDRAIVERCAREAGSAISVMQIASGGCTAALLAGLPCVSHLHVVDPNPGQLALTRIKLHLLRHHPPTVRSAVLGHHDMVHEKRVAAIQDLLRVLDLPHDCCGSAQDYASGLDQCGRYESVFSTLRQVLSPQAPLIRGVLELSDPTDQQRRVHPETVLGRAIDSAFAEVMALPHLAALFGTAATRQAALPFSVHFAQRLRYVLSTLPAVTNPFLWQMLMGIYPTRHLVDWLIQPSPASLPAITSSNSTMDVALVAAPGKFHVVHLSNILDWLTPAEAKHTLDLAWEALRPGGWVIIRQLNSVLTIPELSKKFLWMTSEAAMQHAIDRSFFYRSLHFGRKI